jgi:hypothetical protein
VNELSNCGLEWVSTAQAMVAAQLETAPHLRAGDLLSGISSVTSQIAASGTLTADCKNTARRIALYHPSLPRSIDVC